MSRDQVFISYSHADSKWLKALQTMLAPLRRHGKLDVWDDTRIDPGKLWKEEIKQALARVKVAVLLVTPDFLASDFIHDNELPPLLEAAANEGLIILWVPIRHSLYKKTAIADFQAAYNPQTPLVSLNEADQGAALLSIAERIEKAFQTNSRPSPTSAPEPAPASTPASNLKNTSDCKQARIVLPPRPVILRTIQSIHGWPAEKVKGLQSETARSLGLPVEFQDTLEAGGQGPLMIVIPGGRFLMGSPENEPERNNDERQHEVELYPFAMGKYAVTFEEYDRFAEATSRKKPNDSGWGRGRRPVINVRWFDAVAYLEWLSSQTGHAYWLPTEAEWEYACRAGTTTAFHFGDTITTSQANYAHPQGTVEVGQFPANTWGLHDMHGNVWEWTGSQYDANYGGAEQRCISNDHAGGPWVVRGGSWIDVPRGLRGAARSGLTAIYRGDARGFRPARTFSL